jgi:hypothetical protein
MARAKSAILSPADKRAVLKDLKTRFKAATSEAKVGQKAYDVAEKAHDKAQAAAAKVNIKRASRLANLKTRSRRSKQQSKYLP